ncbi:MAG: PAS domain S-box protein [Thermoanaerobaculales bacterium]|jgi:PAS domain S-box-containing protein|nr:PAS domain S-box protein [Thermoanaerobaculales bacterium]
MTQQIDLHQPVTTIAHQDVVMLSEDHTIQQALDYIRSQDFGEKIVYFYVVNGEQQLTGVILTRRLLTAPLDKPLSDLMIKRIITVPDTATVLEAYDLMAHHKLLALPVVNREQRVVGVVDLSTFMDEKFIGNITQRKIERLEIERLNTRLRSILDHMRELVLSFSYSGKLDKTEIQNFSFFDDHLVEVNSSALSFFEVPASYILNKKKSIFDFIFDLDKKAVFDHYIDLFERGSAETTYRIVTQTGEVKWVHDYGRVEYLNTGEIRRVNHIIEDVTEKKKALDELHASEQKYRRIFENSKDMIYVLKPSGQIIDINLAGIRLLGLSSEEDARERTIADFYVDPKARDSLIEEILEKGEATRDRMLVQNAEGERFEIGLNVIAQQDDSGQVVSYQGIAHNITEAIRQKELEAIGQLAGGFADDLASPLSVILMGVESVRSSLANLESQSEGSSSRRAATEIEKGRVSAGSVFSDINYFLNDVSTAAEDVRSRLKEMKDQYWDLRKVPDGSGGMIYERRSKLR